MNELAACTNAKKCIMGIQDHKRKHTIFVFENENMAYYKNLQKQNLSNK